MRSLLAVFALAVSALAQGWVDVTPAVPGPRNGTGFCYDPVRGVSWLFVASISWPNIGPCSTYSWNGTAWNLVGQGPQELPVDSVWDPIRQQVVVAFAAINQSLSSLQGWDGTTWTNLPFPSLSGNNPRIAFDHARGQLVAMGDDLSFVSVFDGSSWNVVAPVVSPNVTLNRALFYSQSRGRVTLVGEANYNPPVPACWEWTGGNWVQSYPAGVEGQVGQVASAPQRGINLSMVFTQTLGFPRALNVGSQGFSTLFLTSYPAMRQGHRMVYDSGRDTFVLHSGSNFADTWELQLGPSASYSSFGAGCLGSRGVPALAPQGSPVPRVGTPFTLQVSNLPWTGPAFMFFGFSNSNYGSTALPFNLGSLGAPQCNLLVSGDVLNTIPNVLGVSTWNFFVPNYPGLVFYNQAFAFDSVANPLGLTVSNAGRGVIGS